MYDSEIDGCDPELNEFIRKLRNKVKNGESVPTNDSEGNKINLC